MKVYVSGKITGLDPKEYLARFAEAQLYLEFHGHKVMNPASAMSGCTTGFSDDDYQHVCYAMIDTCDAIYMLGNWQGSKGARKELQYAFDWRKQVMYQDEATRENDFPVRY